MGIEPKLISREVKVDEDKRKVVVFRGFGRRLKLEVDFYPEEIAATTRVRQTNGEHKKGVTKALYQRVRQELQEIANAKGPVSYIMVTTNERMKDFFINRAGRSLFEWDEKPTYKAAPDDETALFMYATIKPK